MPELSWLLQNDLSNQPSRLSKNLDDSLLNGFLNRDFSNDTEAVKIMSVFKQLFEKKELINLPSDYQADQNKYESQLEQQLAKVKTSLLTKMKNKKQRQLGAIRADAFTYKELTSLFEGLIGGIEYGVKFELEGVFRLVVENQCIECCNKASQKYMEEIQRFFVEDRP